MFFSYNQGLFFMSIDDVCGKNLLTNFLCFKHLQQHFFIAGKLLCRTLQRPRTRPVILEKLNAYSRLNYQKLLAVSWNSFLKSPKCLIP